MESKESVSNNESIHMKQIRWLILYDSTKMSNELVKKDSSESYSSELSLESPN